MLIRVLTVLGLMTVCGFSQGVSKGFEHFYNLEYTDAIREFQASAAKEPNNPNVFNHLAQAVLYQEMFRAGALESELVSGSNPFIGRERVKASPESEKLFHDSLAKSMSISQARIKTNANDTAAMYSLGVAHGLRANYNFLVRKAWMDSLKDATEARKLHNRVLELDPNFIDAKLVQGVHDYVVGSLPWHLKMLGFVAGYRGDREQGIKTLHLVAEKGKLNQYDAQVLLAAIYRRERRPKDALPLLKPLIERFPRNYLLRLETVQMYSDAGDKDSALAALAKAEELKKSGAAGYAALTMEKIYFYRGNLLFWYRDFNGAIEQLRKVTPKASSLDTNTAVMAWLRLGQSLDMAGRRPEAIEAYKQAAAVAPQSEAGKESRDYLSRPYKRKV